MTLKLDQSSVEDLDLALRLYRRLVFRLLAILVLGFGAVIGLSHLGTALSPPYGIYILGWGLATWGLIGLLALIVLELWWEGRQIGRALNDPGMQASPIAGLMGGIGVIAERAQAMGMEWSGFLGPLRPARRR
ncbi:MULTISPECIES: ABC transporter ATP-binding protein [Methylobacterium]|uniref:ABC transporter ATP-binding protein n=1 Tax=Methylobacterium thuringiense TaxID=1003091 RepID=A0ABQ4TKW7_9HYPH|nr:MULTISPECIES: ABC transporter ATP-binding protein [Methylobacterium]TXN23945.1 ABC transporter ATP-binding protein [Methylobacterium sp. WL9]GJE55212.1 hypothetical protein EKPJFOCH_1701 [Methylobacterium thuringiense]